MGNKLEQTYTNKLENWKKRISIAREQDLLTEDNLFILLFDTHCMLDQLDSKKDFDEINYYTEFIKPVKLILKEDFDLNGESSASKEEKDKFLDWYDKKRKKFGYSLEEKTEVEQKNILKTLETSGKRFAEINNLKLSA